jgi:hypothetical protein
MGDGFREVFELSDVQNGTPSDVFRESVSVEVDSYFDRVPGDERRRSLGSSLSPNCVS